MLDCGASCCFINPRFVGEQNLLQIKKKHSLRLRTVDNSEVKSGLMTHEVHLRIFLGDHEEVLNFDVADIGDDNLILGLNWLRKHNPTIDWHQSSVEFLSKFCQEKCLPKPVIPVLEAAARKAVPTGGPRCPPRKAVLEKTRRAARRLAAAQKRGEVVLSLEEQERLKLLESAKPQGGIRVASARKTNTMAAGSRTQVPRSHLQGLNVPELGQHIFGGVSGRRLFVWPWAAIDDAIVKQEEVVGGSCGGLGSWALEQQWDGESVYGQHGPEVRGAAVGQCPRS